MDLLIYLVTSTLRIFVFAMMVFLFARAILSWVPVDDDSAIVRIVYGVTDPLLIPARFLIDRSETLSSLPIDFSFLITYIVLDVLYTFL